MAESPRDRIKPYPALSEMLGYIFFAILAAVIVGGGLWLFNMDRILISGGWMRLAGIAIILFGGWLFYRFSRPLVYLIATIGKRNRFNEASATAQAEIKNRRIIEHKSNYGDTYTYEVVVGFEANQTNGFTKPILLRTYVTCQLYNSISSPLTIRYSQDDPRIAVLEGEKHFAPSEG